MPTLRAVCPTCTGNGFIRTLKAAAARNNPTELFTRVSDTHCTACDGHGWITIGTK